MERQQQYEVTGAAWKREVAIAGVGAPGRADFWQFDSKGSLRAEVSVLSGQSVFFS